VRATKIIWNAYQQCEAAYFCDDVPEHRRALQMLNNAHIYLMKQMDIL
jgi:hypothetical protein